MNRSNILQTIADDLQIKRFVNEDDYHYEGRLMYSPIAAWCRNMMQDKSYSDLTADESIIGVSMPKSVDKNHVLYRLEQVIRAMNNIFINGKAYLNMKNSDKSWHERDVANKILSDMIFSYECSQTKKSRMCETPVRHIDFFGKSVLSLGGTDYESKGIYLFTGCGKWYRYHTDKTDDNCYDFWNISHNSDEYLSNMIKNAAWRDTDVDNSYSVLDINYKQITLYNPAWIPLTSKKVRFPISIIKKDSRFYLMRNEQELQISELNKWYIDENEIFRIIAALKREYKKPHKIHITNNGDHITVSLGIFLPNPESRIMRLSSWGYNNAFDYFNRIVPINIWLAIEPLFNNLGFEIEYA